MSTTEKFCLKWNDFQDNIASTFGYLRNDTDFADVTLACEDDQQVQVHKVILAASSPLFQNLLTRNKHAHPLIYMRGMKSEDLVAIVDFMYHGEANIFQENLDAFLTIADELKLKGLTGTQANEMEIPPSGNTYKNIGMKSNIPEIPPKQMKIKKDKSEIAIPQEDVIADRTIVLPSGSYSEDLQDLNTKIRSMMAPGKQIMDNGRKVESLCTVCGKEGRMQTIKDHIEVHHIEGISHPCSYCDKNFRSRAALKTHFHTYHKQ